MTVLRHLYRAVISGTFIVLDITRHLIEPDAACAEHQKSGDLKPKRSQSTRAALMFTDTPSPMLATGNLLLIAI